MPTCCCLAAKYDSEAGHFWELFYRHNAERRAGPATLLTCVLLQTYLLLPFAAKYDSEAGHFWELFYRRNAQHSKGPAALLTRACYLFVYIGHHTERL
jgi:hypothetical protein